MNRICPPLLPNARRQKNTKLREAIAGFYLLSTKLLWQFLWSWNQKIWCKFYSLWVCTLFFSWNWLYSIILSVKKWIRYWLDYTRKCCFVWGVLLMWISCYGKKCSWKTHISRNYEREDILGTILKFRSTKIWHTLPPCIFPILFCTFIKIIHNILTPSI